jgi:hypothetical protein
MFGFRGKDQIQNANITCYDSIPCSEGNLLAVVLFLELYKTTPKNKKPSI